MKLPRTILFLALALTLSTATAQLSGTYTVNPSQPASPTNFTTLLDVVNQLLAGGVTGPVVIEIYDDAGAYTESHPLNTSSSWTPPNAGLSFQQWAGVSATNTVTWVAAAGEFPVIDATGRGFGIYWGGADYVIVDGLEIHGAANDGISFYSDGTSGQPLYNTIRNCYIHDIGTAGINVYGNGAPNPIDTHIYNCIIESCQLAPTGSFSTLSRFGYVSSRRTTGTIVTHCTFYGGTGNGAILGSDSGSATNRWAEMSNNVLYKTTGPGSVVAWRDGVGTHPMVGDNNIFYDVSAGIFCDWGGSSDPDLAAYQTTTSQEAASLAADPMLVNPATHDYHLQLGSPAIDAGAVHGLTVTHDFEGDPRGVPPDMGADEVYLSAEILLVDTAPTAVAPGETGIAVTMDVQNLDPADDISVTTAGLLFTGTADRTSEYTVTPDPGNPALIPASGTVTFTFTVDVSATATEETITLEGTLDGAFVVGGGVIQVSGAGTPDSWDVVGARPEVRTVDAVPPLVAQGSSGNVVNLAVENVGLTDWIPGTITMSFMGTADRTSEYTVAPDPGNPVLVAVGATETFAVLVDVDPAATVETITIDVATFDGTDVVTGLTQSDSGADVTDTWDVTTCLTTLCGDCNLDTQVTIVDALAAAQHSAGLSALTGSAFTNCNVTGLLEPDPAAAVTILDALTIAQYSAGIAVTLACC